MRPFVNKKFTRSCGARFLTTLVIISGVLQGLSYKFIHVNSNTQQSPSRESDYLSHFIYGALETWDEWMNQQLPRMGRQAGMTVTLDFSPVGSPPTSLYPATHFQFTNRNQRDERPWSFMKNRKQSWINRRGLGAPLYDLLHMKDMLGRKKISSYPSSFLWLV